MTVVGKILVFLNLVFSLAVGAVAVMDYTARTHWADAFNDAKEKNTTLRSVADTYKREADRLAAERAQLYEKLNAQRVVWAPASKDDPDVGSRIADLILKELSERTRILDQVKTELKTTQEAWAKDKATIASYRAQEQADNLDRNRRQADADALRAQLKSEYEKNFQLVREVNKARDEMVQAQIAARTFKDRNSQLEAALRDSQRELAQLKASGVSRVAGGLASTSVNPPPANVEGLVRRADGNLVTISLGSDAGMARGQTLEVFRLGQNAKYIGRIRIVDVTAKEAVGQVVGRVSTPIQVNDRVASRILGE
jgi:hypothetical protein